MSTVEAPFLLYGGELSQEATVAKFATVQIEDGREPTVSKIETVKAEGTLTESTTTEDFSVVQNEGGSNRAVKHMKSLAGMRRGEKK